MYPNKFLTELIEDALNEEVKDNDFYDGLAAEISDIDDKNKLKQMSLDEKKHYNMLKEIYEKLTGKEFSPQKEADKNEAESIVKSIENAIDKELESVEMYRPILFALENPAFKNYLQEIITDEQNHAARLNYMYSKYK